MKYELAKKLKDAGFPQEIKFGDIFYSDDYKEYLNSYDEKRKLKKFETRQPTLSELVESCGEIEFIIHCYPKNHNNDITGEPWFVIERSGIEDMERQPTPEEAVANLYLELIKS